MEITSYLVLSSTTPGLTNKKYTLALFRLKNNREPWISRRARCLEPNEANNICLRVGNNTIKFVKSVNYFVKPMNYHQAYAEYRELRKMFNIGKTGDPIFLRNRICTNKFYMRLN